MTDTTTNFNQPPQTVEEWLNNEELPITIWRNKYQHNGESFEQWLDRVSGKEERVKELIREQKFIFAGRILANRGVTDRKVTYSNCYVGAPPEDNLESIFDAGSKMARTFSYGGGIGLDVSKLRPKGVRVNNAAQTTSGATTFMDLYSYITGLIAQNGRRGAAMLSLSCEHPDLEEFINLKSNLDVCTKANISVRMTDAFMKAVDKNEEFVLHFTMEEGSKITKIVNAREMFKLLALRNWEMAEPGILYWDRISNYNMMQGTGFHYAGTNPCGEQALPAFGACLLGSLNLSNFVYNPFQEHAYIDFSALSEAVETAVYALNEVLTEGISLHPLKEQRDTVAKWRQIGLGTLGLGDMLIKLGIKYGSEESFQIIHTIYRDIAQTAIKASLKLAKEKGAFSACTEDIRKAIVNSDFIKNLMLPDSVLKDIETYGLYNSQLLTCAPTGTIGTMLQVSTGVEPNFAFSYNRRTVSLNNEETTYKVETKIVKDFKAATGATELPDYFVASADIDYHDRIKVQAMLQTYIDASISSTINLPHETTVEQVFDLYMEAWRQGLKGVTIFRDGCKRQGILTTDKKPKEEAKKTTTQEIKIREVSSDCIGLKRKLQTGCGSLHLLAYFCPTTGQLLETYFSKGSTGGCALFMTGLSRMVSLAARAGVPIENIVDQLLSSGTCPSYAVRRATKNDTSKGSSCPVAIGHALMEMYKEFNETLKGKGQLCPLPSPEKPAVESLKCPECGEPIQMVEGCMTCPSCGYSKCS